mgnify:CR=1 FL=1
MRSKCGTEAQGQRTVAFSSAIDVLILMAVLVSLFQNLCIALSVLVSMQVWNFTGPNIM